jgi:hypothetical protein
MNEAVCPSIFYPAFTESLVKVEAVEGEHVQQFKITWPVQAGAVGYKVYGSPTPLTKNLLTQDPIPYPAGGYLTGPSIIVPDDIIFYFWVSYLDSNGGEHFIQADAASFFERKNTFAQENTPFVHDYEKYTVDNFQMEFYMNEIRRRAATMLRNDGEEFDVYFRRWSGAVCPCRQRSATYGKQGYVVDDTANLVPKEIQMTLTPDASLDPTLKNDPSFIENVQTCGLCWGTGILGGYYPKIRIIARYGNLPIRPMLLERYGIDQVHDFNTWTLWSPRLRAHDVLVRKLTGERFIVADISESAWRGIPLHQEFRLVTLQQGDIRLEITDERINGATGEHVGAFDPWQ